MAADGFVTLTCTSVSKCNIKNELPISITWVLTGMTSSYTITANSTSTNLEFPQTGGIYRSAALYTADMNRLLLRIMSPPAAASENVFGYWYIALSDNKLIPSGGFLNNSNGRGSFDEKIVYDISEISQINMAIEPVNGIEAINLYTSFGAEIVQPSPIESTYLSWPLSYGNNPTMRITPQSATVNLLPYKLNNAPDENITNLGALVTQNGNTTSYNLRSNPSISVGAGTTTKVEVIAKAPEITVDYTNTAVPVITDTPTSKGG